MMLVPSFLLKDGPGLVSWLAYVSPEGLSDNLLKPLLVRRGMHMHAAVVFVALVSGLSAFGPIGLLLGPLIVSFLLALIRMCRRDFRGS
jgi:predicted PurR-regulated permease PerM